MESVRGAGTTAPDPTREHEPWRIFPRPCQVEARGSLVGTADVLTAEDPRLSVDFDPMLFPVSGVEAPLWLPPLVAFGISLFTSMVGISGAFLLMPFQLSVLGYAGPSASATNLVYNLYATPGGVWRYARDQRMAWPLAGLIVLGTLPGVVAGFYLRTRYLPDAASFRLFAGAVLLLLAWRLLAALVPAASRASATRPFRGVPIRLERANWRRMEFTHGDLTYGFPVPAMLAVAFGVGIIGGAYGVGGGAFIAPLCIAVFHLPVALVAGAALAATFATSLIGVGVYALLPLPGGGHAAPDWALGGLFGLGGLAGMYLGAALQRYVPQRFLQAGLGILLVGLGGSYLWPEG